MIITYIKNYKNIISTLKLETDEKYKNVSLKEQQAYEDQLFTVLYQSASCTKKINDGQLKILNDFSTIFDFSDDRKNKIISHFKETQPKKVNTDFDNAFNKISSEVTTMFPAQESFIKSLIISFKRPFISKPTKSYKNFTSILTTEDELVLDIINQVSLKMKEEVLIFGDTSYIDCSLFTEDNSHIQFLNEIIKALNNNSDVIIFKNFKALSKESIKFVTEFIVNGKAAYNGGANFLEGNNKFFILITSSSEESFINLVGEECFNSFGDLIKLDELSHENIVVLTQNIANNFIAKTRQELQLNLFYDPKLIDFLVNIYNKNIGTKSISNYIDHNIHKPILEYKLKRNPAPDAQLIITLSEDNKIALFDNGQLILLEKLLTKANNANLDKVKEELDKIIGLEPVKDYVLKLEDNVTAQKMREESGLKNSSVSMNMIFTGNPGTGKTTIARIVAEFLKALGVISKGQLVEVSRTDLVGPRSNRSKNS